MILTTEQQTAVETGVTLLNMAKDGATIDEVFKYLYAQGYTDEGAFDRMQNFLLTYDIECFYVERGWKTLVSSLQDVKGTPFWKRILQGLAIAAVKSFSDGHLGIEDLPIIIESMYQSLKEKK